MPSANGTNSDDTLHGRNGRDLITILGFASSASSSFKATRSFPENQR